LTNKYLNGVPGDARGARSGSFKKELLAPETMDRIRSLHSIAEDRGQTLAQMAIAWVLRDPRMTSALIGVRTVNQLNDSLDAINRLDFEHSELDAIERLLGTPESRRR
ncbi:aldo/keto reductase, partial [Novosphingobium sp. HR1a]